MSSQNKPNNDDALEPLVTQCPNCDTRFRVSEAQLQVAGGRVRCGACLTVFDGAEYLMLDGEPLSVEDDDDALDAVLDEIDDFEERQDAPLAEEEVVAGMGVVDALPEAQTSEHGLEDEEATPDLSQLEALEDQLLSDLVKAQNTEGESAEESAETSAESLSEVLAPSGEQPRLEPMRDTAGDDEVDAEAVDAEPDPPHSADLSELDEIPELEGAPPYDEQDLLDATEDIDRLDELPAFAENRAIGPQTEVPQETATLQSAQDWTAEVADDIWQTSKTGSGEPKSFTDRPEEEAGEEAAQDIEEIGEIVDAAGAAGLANIAASADDALIDTSHFEDAAESERSWLTYALIVLALVALPAQVLWFQYEDWVADPQYRPIYVTVCGVVGCEVPALVDVSAIEAQRSVGRVSPDDGVRTIDILMVNKATFAQPFPVIEVVFENLAGDQMAVSRLEANQYLPKSQPVNAQMQPRTPVHVSFDVPDPGVDATGFSVRFLAP